MTEAGVVAEEAHDRKLVKSLEVCQQEGIHFVPFRLEVPLRPYMRQSGSGPRWKVLALDILLV